MKTIEKIWWIGDQEYRHCPVCGHEVELYSRCEHCNWENTGEHDINGGPNKMTLTEAKEAYEKGKSIK